MVEVHTEVLVVVVGDPLDTGLVVTRVYKLEYFAIIVCFASKQVTRLQTVHYNKKTPMGIRIEAECNPRGENLNCGYMSGVPSGMYTGEAMQGVLLFG